MCHRHAVTQSLVYGPFGEVVSGADENALVFAYNAEERNPVTGLDYLRARYYAPDAASFITRDSTPGTLPSINSQNRYAFAEADPVNNADPSGHAVSNNAYERVMEAAGGINELYNFYVGRTLQNSYNQAASAFNARLSYAYGVDYRSLAAINSISGISQATANAYIAQGAAAALKVGATYGCNPGALTGAAIGAFAANVNTAKETTNQKIASVKSNKHYQYRQYQAYLAWVAEQQRLAYEAERQRQLQLGAMATAYMLGMARGIQQSQARQRVLDVGNRIRAAATGAVSSVFGGTIRLDKGGSTDSLLLDLINYPFTIGENLTRWGLADWIINPVLGTDKVDGIYHIRQDYWQSFKPVGYNDLYDNVLFRYSSLIGGGADSEKFDFTVNGEDYMIWVWKGDYGNIGAGAELGIYEYGLDLDPTPGTFDHWFTAPELAMPMTLSLENKRTGDMYIDNYSPGDQWRITGFDPQHQNVGAADLTATFTVDFSGRQEMRDGFLRKYRTDERWVFDGSNYQAEFRW
ncbi:MAG: RHS repeat-associated core domain-containing protein [Coriobacteriales bacterium]|jgi:RHS repeat-associated protein|nr:RHS repeat-associated core domain-containing protein [Coriobacteriales bacterium]